MSSVMIIQSNDFFRKSFKKILQRHLPLLSIVEAANATEALHKIKHHVPDMVFLDIRVSGGNGLELAREIKASHPNVVVSIFTHYDFPEYREIAEKHGVDHFLQKDHLSGAEIAETIREVLSGKKRGRQKANAAAATMH